MVKYIRRTPDLAREHLPQRCRFRFLSSQLDPELIALALDVVHLVFQLLDPIDLLLPVLLRRDVVAVPLDEDVLLVRRRRGGPVVVVD